MTDNSIVYSNTEISIYTANDSDTDGSVSYSIAFSDIAGNAGNAVNGTGNVTTDTTEPTLNSVTIASNNTNSSKVTPADVVSLNFTASETIQTPTVTFSSGGAPLNGNITFGWTASFTTTSNDTAVPSRLRLFFSDLAGNAGTTVTATNNSSRVVLIIDSDLPTLISSDPLDNSKSVQIRSKYYLRI